MSIEWNEELKKEKDISPLGTVEMCNICRKPLEECPEWRQAFSKEKEKRIFKK